MQESCFTVELLLWLRSSIYFFKWSKIILFRKIRWGESMSEGERGRRRKWGRNERDRVRDRKREWRKMAEWQRMTIYKRRQFLACDCVDHDLNLDSAPSMASWTLAGTTPEHSLGSLLSTESGIASELRLVRPKAAKLKDQKRGLEQWHKRCGICLSCANLGWTVFWSPSVPCGPPSQGHFLSA